MSQDNLAEQLNRTRPSLLADKIDKVHGLVRVVIGSLVVVSIAWSVLFAYQHNERERKAVDVCNAIVAGFDKYTDRAIIEFYPDNPTPEQIRALEARGDSIMVDVEAAIREDC